MSRLRQVHFPQTQGFEYSCQTLIGVDDSVFVPLHLPLCMLIEALVSFSDVRAPLEHDRDEAVHAGFPLYLCFSYLLSGCVGSDVPLLLLYDR